MSRTNMFGSVVIIVQVVSRSPRGEVHVSYNPAKQNERLDFRSMRIGVFDPPVFCHSKNPSAIIRQRRILKALLKAALSVNVSARALISLLPIFGSVADAG